MAKRLPAGLLRWRASLEKAAQDAVAQQGRTQEFRGDGEVQRDTPTSATACLYQSESRCAGGAKGGSTGSPAKRKGRLQALQLRGKDTYNGGARTVAEQAGGDISRAEQDGKTEP